MMENLFDTKISFYENVADNVGTEISLRDFLFCDQYKEQIEHIRSIADEEQQKSLKKKSLSLAHLLLHARRKTS